jgi:hypothetical protein
MKKPVGILLLALAASVTTRSQVSITADDMFNQVGLYYLAYSNPFDPTSLTPTSWTVPSTLIGHAGASNIWDFSTGPTDLTYRFDYLSLTNTALASIAASFPQATIVEQQKNMTDTNAPAQDLFFSWLPGSARTVFGFYAEDPISGSPTDVFDAPIQDFPATMSYGQTWQTTATWENSQAGIPIQYVQTADFSVDAYGTIVLPTELGAFGPGIRLRETDTTTVNADFGTGSGFEYVETDYNLVYRWLMPGRGIVAELGSVQSSQAMPPDNFTQATQFWRMFQTNHKAASSTGGNCIPDPVTDLKIKVSNGQALLSWSKANCATQYRLDYSSRPADPTSWTPLTTVTNQLLVLDSINQNSTRFYRVVSIK